MIPLFSSSQVREVDSLSIQKLGIPGLVLMENASISIYQSIIKHFPELSDDTIIGIVCGKGNNGGDGFAVARHFANAGYTVKLLFLAGEDELTGDALTNYLSIKNISGKLSNISLKKFLAKKDINFLKGSSLIIDALLGTGTKGELKEPYQSIINKLNSFNCYKVSIDLPSGLNADTGYGKTIFQADLTVTLAEFKRGLFINFGAASAGKIVKGYIGIPPNLFDKFEVTDYLIEPEDVLFNLPHKLSNIHKYQSGKVLTIAGSKNYTGAALLTANAVLRSGGGASLLALPASIRSAAYTSVELVVHSYNDDSDGIYKIENINELLSRFDWMDVLAIGPGIGRESQTIEAVIETIQKNKNKKIVIDADALFALGEGRYKSCNLENKVLTPHLNEFAQLIGTGKNIIEKDILSSGKKFVNETGAYLVLKGAPTIIFLPGGEALINTTGNSGMAKFGTGDVLTGIIASFIAQQDDIEKALIGAVYIHSLAADLLKKEYSEYGYTASDIIQNIPIAIQFLRETFAQLS